MRARVAVLLPVALAVASCASLVREEVAAPPQGGSVSLRTGAPLIVSLPPDPDTGYGWVLRSASPNLLLIGGPDYTPQPKPPGLVGMGDTTAYRFRAAAPGPAALEFVWAGPPGQAQVPQRVVRYDVQITNRLPLPSDFFGTVGMESVRGGAYAPASDAAPVKVNTAPMPAADAPAGATTPSAVKYWSF